MSDETLDLLRELADDLEAEINDRYHFPDVHPAMQAKYERDTEPVRKARTLLARSAPAGVTRIGGWVPNWNPPPSSCREESEYAEFYYKAPQYPRTYERWTPATLLIHVTPGTEEGKP